MTKKQFMKKYREMIRTTLAEKLIEDGEKAFRSGAFDPKDYLDDYVLPKIVLTVALETASKGYMPLYKGHRDTLANLRHFI